jgi:hypothetical protein
MSIEFSQVVERPHPIGGSRERVATFAAALESNQRGDNYSLLTVLFAMVLFFTAMSERNTSGWAGWFLLGLGAVVAIAGGIILATLPVLF